MIIQVGYARLYNTGNYENIRFEAIATVENGNTVAAFTEAKDAVHAEFIAWEAEKEAEQQRRRDAYETEQQRRRDAAQAKRNLDNF